jgi:hypothetical protein
VSLRHVELTTRDDQLLRSLREYRFLTDQQVERLHFPSRQTAARRVRLLEQAGYVKSFRSILVGRRIVELTRRGALALDGEGTQIHSNGLPRSRPRSEYFLRHSVAITEFRITLAAACRTRRDVRLLGFLPDSLVQRDSRRSFQPYTADEVLPTHGAGLTIRHVPDGVLALRRYQRAGLFFLEVDRGSETVSDPARGVGKLILFYLRYLQTDRYQRYAADFGVAEPFQGFRVLFVTSSTRRLDYIRSRSWHEPGMQDSGRRFIWLSGDEALTSPDLLAHAWCSLDPTDETRYRIVRESSEAQP